jgi:hypothetical protein
MTLILNGTNGLSDVDGTAATPAIRGTDANTGIFFGTDIIGFSEGGVEAARINADAQFVAAAGTALLPVITTTGDVNTGIFFPAADTIAFSEGGAEAMRIDSSGNVGIGTSSPAAKLDVSGNVRANGASTPSLITENTSTGDAYVDWRSNGALQARAFYSGSVFGITAVPAIPIVFKTNDTERMRIDSSGNLLVGKTTDSFSTQGTVIGPNAEITLARTGSDSVMRFAQTSTGLLVGSINITAISTSYATSSDYRLKENVAPMQNALATVAALKPCTYTWKTTGEAGQGFIAHELQAVVPDCVTGEKDAVETVDDLDAEGQKIGTKEVPRYQGVDTSFLVATLVSAIQEQQALIQDLTARLEAVESK